MQACTLYRLNLILSSTGHALLYKSMHLGKLLYLGFNIRFMQYVMTSSYIHLLLLYKICATFLSEIIIIIFVLFFYKGILETEYVLHISPANTEADQFGW